MKTLLLLKVLLQSTLLVLSITVYAQISVRPEIVLLLFPNSLLKSKAESTEQFVPARIVQNVPLAKGFRSKTGNTNVGRMMGMASATGATNAYRFDESTPYKSIRSSPSAEDLCIPPRMPSLCWSSNPELLKSPRLQADPIVSSPVAVAQHLLRRFLNYHPTA